MPLDSSTIRATEHYLATDNTLFAALDFDIALDVFGSFASHWEDPEEALYGLSHRERSLLIERTLRRMTHAQEKYRTRITGDLADSEGRQIADTDPPNTQTAV